MKFYRLLLMLLASSSLFADRWLVLPPRIEGEASSTFTAGDLARQMALYLKVSRVGEIVSVAESEGCLKQANVSTQGKIRPEELKAVAVNCRAERMLLTRIKSKKDSFEITSKVYFRESDHLTDTLVSSGTALLPTLGSQLTERFAKSPATSKESSADLIIAGDTYGGAYFDWGELKSFFLGVDWVKSAYCLIDSRSKLQASRLRSDRSDQKEFLDKVRFEGSGFYGEAEELVRCVSTAVNQTRHEGRRPVVVFLVSESPRESRLQISLRAALRRLARNAKIYFVPASAAGETTQNFWSGIARELSDTVSYLPVAQRAKVGLANGQEWYIFRRNGRLYETREAEPAEFRNGVRIPDKDAELTSPADLTALYEKLSKNKVITRGQATSDASLLKASLLASFKSASNEVAVWRVLLSQNGQNYYVSLNARDAQTLKVDSYVRIFTELRNPKQTEIFRNRPSPTLVLTEAQDSASGIELNVSEYTRAPEKYLRKSMGGRSFYILSGKVLQIIPPDGDAVDNGF